MGCAGATTPTANHSPTRSLTALALAGVLVAGCAQDSGLDLGGSPASPTAPEVTDEAAQYGASTRHSLELDGLERTWIADVPDPEAVTEERDGLAVIVMIHGTGDTAANLRSARGDHFQQFAGSDGVVMLYPDGYDNNWNECRAEGSWTAKSEDLNDVEFMRRIVDQLESDLGPGSIDREQVFAAGFSSGGHMAMRLGREAPDLVNGLGVISANPPTDDNQACADQTEPMPVTFIQGTADHINPFEGGEVSVGGFNGSRGAVMSAHDGAQWYADVNGATGPESVPADEGVDITEWTGPAPVRLVAVEGGSHTVPTAAGSTSWAGGGVGYDAPGEIWRFLDGAGDDA